MPNYNVTTTKGRNGWKSTTQIELPDQRMLVIVTSKDTNSRGTAIGVEAVAQVGKRERGFVSYSMMLYGDPRDSDFSKQIASSVGKCTEANVNKVHAEALTKVEALLPEIATHYVVKAARVECAKGIHSWADEIGKLPPDTPCTYCGELYGNPD